MNLQDRFKIHKYPNEKQRTPYPLKKYLYFWNLKLNNIKTFYD